MSYDSILKFLVEDDPQPFARWLLGEQATGSISLLNTELNLEPIRVDGLFFLELSGQILHLEFQTRPTSNPPMPLRMLDYWVRLHRQYRVDIEQVVIFLKPTTAKEAFEDSFVQRNTSHRYRVIRLWEIEADEFLQIPSLLPLAVLAKTDQPEQLLRRVTEQLDMIEDRREKQNLMASAQILAGLRFSDQIIELFFREELMQESAVYQRILNQGIEKGLQQGLERGLERGLKQGLQQGLHQGIEEGEFALIMKQLARRFGLLEPRLFTQIQALPRLQMESLGEALLDMQSVDDLKQWLDGNQ